MSLFFFSFKAYFDVCTIFVNQPFNTIIEFDKPFFFFGDCNLFAKIRLDEKARNQQKNVSED